MCCDPVATPTNRRHFPKVPVPWHPGPEVGRPKIRVRSTIGDLVTVRPQCEGTELQSQPGPVPHDVPAEGHIGTPPPPGHLFVLVSVWIVTIGAAAPPTRPEETTT